MILLSITICKIAEIYETMGILDHIPRFSVNFVSLQNSRNIERIRYSSASGSDNWLQARCCLRVKHVENESPRQIFIAWDFISPEGIGSIIHNWSRKVSVAAVSVVWPVVFVILVVWSLEGMGDIWAWVLSWGAQWSSNWNASVGAGSIRGAVRAVVVNFVPIWRAEGIVWWCEAQELGFSLNMLQLLEEAMVRHIAWNRHRLALQIAVHAVYT